eukprot:GDKH01023841.1.p1 GENE.GDKH01023841.1~~GDKH01023841.1.p1  ORF type:complete len:126 (-),score=6.35 GDKH01023841.1:214-591(-)
MLSLSRVVMGGLQRQSILRCGDDTGVIKAAIIGIGQVRKGSGGIGLVVRLSVRDQFRKICKVKKTPRGVIIRRKKETQRIDGSYLKFSENAFAIIEKNKAKGTKITGPVPLEVRHNLKSIARWVF